MIKFRTFFPQAIAVVLLGFTLSHPASAAMIDTPMLLSTEIGLTDVQSQRDSIEFQLVELGVEPSLAADRVARMTDAQVAEITTRLQQQPAGASVGGVLLTVFIVFVITDVIGATDIFPFIKPVK
jgi:hypothetical protein